MSLKKGQEILSGFKNLIFKDEEIEKTAEVRMKFCFECPHKKDLRCGKCGCILSAKIRSEKSSCPVGNW